MQTQSPNPYPGNWRSELGRQSRWSWYNPLPCLPVTSLGPKLRTLTLFIFKRSNAQKLWRWIWQVPAVLGEELEHFWNFLTKACLLVQWTKSALPFSSFSYRKRERWGGWGISIKEKPETIKGGGEWCCPLRKPARALELGLLRNFCNVPNEVRKLFVGSKRSYRGGPTRGTWQEESGKEVRIYPGQKCVLILNPPKPKKKRKGLMPWLPTSGVGQPNKELLLDFALHFDRKHWLHCLPSLPEHCWKEPPTAAFGW